MLAHKIYFEVIKSDKIKYFEVIIYILTWENNHFVYIIYWVSPCYLPELFNSRAESSQNH